MLPLHIVIKRVLYKVLPSSFYLRLNAWIAARDIRAEKRFEPEIACLHHFIRPGDRVVDVGANHGLYAYHLSRLVGPIGEVHCFEPAPYNLAILRRSLKSLGLHNVTVHPYLCGDSPGSRLLHVPTIQGVPVWGLSHLNGNEKLTLSAQMVALDDTIAGPVRFIKCDAEGAESFVLRGAQKIIRQFQPAILVEVDVEPAWTARLSYTPQQALADIFTPAGYKTYQVRGNDLVETEGFIDSGNYFVLPPSDCANLLAGDHRSA